jgi:hypothetical protein
MTRFLKYLIPLALLVVIAAAVVVSAQALNGKDEAPQPAAGPLAAEAVIPGNINYQGYLLDDLGDPVDGLVNLQFDLFKDSTGGASLWSQTKNGVDVDQGYFAVSLGPLTAADFTLPAGATTLYIQVTVGGGSALPRQPLTSAPYAFLSQQAAEAPWDGLTGVPPGFADGVDDVEFANVVTVAKSGGQFTSIQEAINSITDAEGDNRYLVWIGPGIYNEEVVTKPFVYLRGAGQWLTRIQSTAGNDDFYPPSAATLVLADYVHVRDLTVQNSGGGFRNVAILALDGVNFSKLQDVVAITNGPGDNNYAILLVGLNTAVTLQNVDTSCSHPEPANYCVGLEVSDGANATVRGGRFYAINGAYAAGIVSRQPETRVELYDVNAEAADSDVAAFGLSVSGGAIANLYGGKFEARNAISNTYGILLYDGAAMEATGVVALGHDGGSTNHGLLSELSEVVLHGGSYTGWGGTEVVGIRCSGGGRLEGNNVKANAGSDPNALNRSQRNDGVRVESSGHATFNGGFFFASGGLDNRGMAVHDGGSSLDVQNAEIQGEGDLGAEPARAGFGVTNELSAVALISLSELGGVSNALLANGDYTAIQLSKVAGSISGSGGLDCAGITNLGVFYPACP